jgi:hypothetical protein
VKPRALRQANGVGAEEKIAQRLSRPEPDPYLRQAQAFVATNGPVLGSFISAERASYLKIQNTHQCKSSDAGPIARENSRSENTPRSMDKK